MKLINTLMGLAVAITLTTGCAVKSRGLYDNVYDNKWFGLNKHYHVWVYNQAQDGNFLLGRDFSAYLYYAESLSPNLKEGYFTAKVHKIDYVVNNATAMPTVQFREPKEMTIVLNKQWPSILIGEFTKDGYYITLYTIDRDGNYQVVIPRKRDI